MKKYVMVIDEGTSSTRCLIFDRQFNIVSQSSEEINTFGTANEVEQDGNEIFEKSVEVCKKAMALAGIQPEEILCMGITNQRSTCLPWDRSTGEPLCKAINWADARTQGIVQQIIKDGWMDKIVKVMMWPQSAPLLSLCWLIKNNELIKEKFKSNELMFGSIDTWMVYKLTGGKKYITSFSNLSMFSGFNFVEMKWHKEYLKYLGIPISILPDIVDDSGEIGVVDKKIFGAEIPISGVIADQQSGSFAHRAIEAGMVKCTIGTGAFVDISVGDKFLPAPNGLFSIATCKIKDKSIFQIEGIVLSAGTVMKWMRDNLNLIDNYEEIQMLTVSVKDAGGVFFVPSLTGLGTPYWDFDVFGTMIGFSRSTQKAHIIRAALEGIVFRIRDTYETVTKKCGMDINLINVDGGLCKADSFCQMIADFTGVKTKRPKLTEITALGAAEAAGLGMGFWNEDDIDRVINNCDEFIPKQQAKKNADSLYEDWKEVVEMSRDWYKKTK